MGLCRVLAVEAGRRLALTLPLNDGGVPPEVPTVPAELDRPGKRDLRVAHPPPDRHIGDREELTQLAAADVPLIRLMHAGPLFTMQLSIRRSKTLAHISSDRRTLLHVDRVYTRLPSKIQHIGDLLRYFIGYIQMYSWVYLFWRVGHFSAMLVFGRGTARKTMLAAPCGYDLPHIPLVTDGPGYAHVSRSKPAMAFAPYPVRTTVLMILLNPLIYSYRYMVRLCLSFFRNGDFRGREIRRYGGIHCLLNDILWIFPQWTKMSFDVGATQSNSVIPIIVIGTY